MGAGDVWNPGLHFGYKPTIVLFRHLQAMPEEKEGAVIYVIIWAHWVCDFILQTDSMAKGKSSSNVWLLRHVTMYTAALICILVWHAVAGVLVYAVVNGIAHFATDYVTSRITKRLWAKGEVHNFFVVIGLDQAIHLTTLIATLRLLKP